MSLRILVDMNLSPDWIPILQSEGWSAIHWSQVGSPQADDRTIMEWAQRNRHVVFTHDLDFGTALALTHRNGPSVVQLRDQNVLPGSTAAASLLRALRQHEAELDAGALLIVEASRNRVRILPL